MDSHERGGSGKPASSISIALVERRPCVSVSVGVAVVGGALNLTKCGETCGAKTDSSQWIGWVGVVFAVSALGSTYVPVKKFDTGDGMPLINTRASTPSLI